MSNMKLLLDVVQDMKTLSESLESLANAIGGQDTPGEAPVRPTQPTENAPPPTAPAITIVELRSFVAERSTPENRAKIKAILVAHGVNKLTELPEEQYAAVMQEVAAL